MIRVLSTLDSAPVHVESLMDGLDFGSSVNRARFEAEVVSKSAADFVAPVQAALDLAGVDSGGVHKLILCGGATKVAKIKKAVTGLIPKGMSCIQFMLVWDLCSQHLSNFSVC